MTMKTHTFDSTGDAYDACQCDESIRKGDVLFIPSEGVVGIAGTWPIAITEKSGNLHQAEVGDLMYALRDQGMARHIKSAVRFAEKRGLEPVPEVATLPHRRARGMVLTHEDGDLFVKRLGYSASLMCAAFEGELHHEKDWIEPMQLSDADMKVVRGWMDRFDDYFALNGWPTWGQLNEGAEQAGRE